MATQIAINDIARSGRAKRVDALSRLAGAVVLLVAAFKDAAAMRKDAGKRLPFTEV